MQTSAFLAASVPRNRCLTDWHLVSAAAVSPFDFS